MERSSIKAPHADRLVSMLLVGALHAAGLYSLWAYKLLPDAETTSAVFVDFIAPVIKVKPPEPKAQPPASAKLSPRQPSPQAPQPLAAQVPATSVSDLAVPAMPVPATPVTPQENGRTVIAPTPAAPVALTEELSVACPTRTTPVYPNTSRRLGETGVVVVQVELDEHGLVSTAVVQSGSGFTRLDAAALDAVRNWKCNPARRSGQAVRSIAQQPFRFFLK
jgi:periplasmic protein TonB